MPSDFNWQRLYIILFRNIKMCIEKGTLEIYRLPLFELISQGPRVGQAVPCYCQNASMYHFVLGYVSLCYRDTYQVSLPTLAIPSDKTA